LKTNNCLFIANSENHKFQGKRFKPAFDSPSPAAIETIQQELNGSYSCSNDSILSAYESPKPPSPDISIINDDRNERSSPKQNESQ